MRQRRTTSIGIVMGIVLVLLSCGGLVGLVSSGRMPPFTWWLAVDRRHVLVIWYGPIRPPCSYPAYVCALAPARERELRMGSITADAHGGVEVYDMVRLRVPVR